MPTLQCGRCNADPITLLEMDRWPFGAANLTVQKHDVALMSLDWHQRVLHYVHLRLCQQRSQVKCGRAPCKNMPARNLWTHWLHGGTLSELSLGKNMIFGDLRDMC